MIRCLITDRRQAGGVERLAASIDRNLAARAANWIQIREKDMPDRELAALVRRVAAMAAPHGARVLVNTRADVALACGAHGVHLPSGSLPPFEFRAIAPEPFLIGASCHTEAEAEAAELEGASYVLFGPVFAPLSKVSHTPPQGLDTLRRVTGRVRIPVLALGGITPENTAACLSAGAAGIAAITLFLA